MRRHQKKFKKSWYIPNYSLLNTKLLLGVDVKQIMRVGYSSGWKFLKFDDWENKYKLNEILHLYYSTFPDPPEVKFTLTVFVGDDVGVGVFARGWSDVSPGGQRGGYVVQAQVWVGDVVIEPRWRPFIAQMSAPAAVAVPTVEGHHYREHHGQQRRGGRHQRRQNRIHRHRCWRTCGFTYRVSITDLTNKLVSSFRNYCCKAKERG